MKPVSQWGKPMALRTEEQVSSFALDVRALHYVVNDTVVETRGVPVVYSRGAVHSMSARYYCRHCGQTVRRQSRKYWITSWCERTHRYVRLIRVTR